MDLERRLGVGRQLCSVVKVSRNPFEMFEDGGWPMCFIIYDEHVLFAYGHRCLNGTGLYDLLCEIVLSILKTLMWFWFCHVYCHD